MDEHALDGNALAAPLRDIFGTEFTTAVTTCAACGETRTVAELVVFVDAPGTVARCRRCNATLVVLIARGVTACLDLTGLSALDATDPAR